MWYSLPKSAFCTDFLRRVSLYYYSTKEASLLLLTSDQANASAKLFEVHGHRGVLRAKASGRAELEERRLVVNYGQEVVLIHRLPVKSSRLFWVWYIGGGLTAVGLAVVVVRYLRNRGVKREDAGEVSDYTINVDDQTTLHK